MIEECFAPQARKNKASWRQNWRFSRHLFRRLWSLHALVLQQSWGQLESLKLLLKYKSNIRKMLVRPNAFFAPLSSHLSNVSAASWDFVVVERDSAVIGIAIRPSAIPTWSIEWRWSSLDESLPKEPSVTSNTSWISALKPAWKVYFISVAWVLVDKRYARYMEPIYKYCTNLVLNLSNIYRLPVNLQLIFQSLLLSEARANLQALKWVNNVYKKAYRIRFQWTL